MPGPAPSPHARRRNARPGTMTLPASGRPGPPPEWPLLTEPRGWQDSGLAELEQDLWARLWAKPQAVAWEHDQLDREVAMYCRCSLLAERGERYALAEARQLADRLGLTSMAMRRLQWSVSDDELGAERDARASAEPQAASTDARHRFRAVDGGA